MPNLLRFVYIEYQIFLKGITKSIYQTYKSRVATCFVLQKKQSCELPMVLKEPIEKRRYLARFFTSLVSVTFFTKRERGDGGP